MLAASPALWLLATTTYLPGFTVWNAKSNFMDQNNEYTIINKKYHKSTNHPFHHSSKTLMKEKFKKEITRARYHPSKPLSYIIENSFWKLTTHKTCYKKTFNYLSPLLLYWSSTNCILSSIDIIESMTAGCYHRNLSKCIKNGLHAA